MHLKYFSKCWGPSLKMQISHCDKATLLFIYLFGPWLHELINQSGWLGWTDVLSSSHSNDIDNTGWQAHYLCHSAPNIVCQTRRKLNRAHRPPSLLFLGKHDEDNEHMNPFFQSKLNGNSCHSQREELWAEHFTFSCSLFITHPPCQGPKCNLSAVACVAEKHTVWLVHRCFLPVYSSSPWDIFFPHHNRLALCSFSF